jgi:plasmid stability protein
MNTPKRAIVYFDADIHRALRLRAAASDQSISDMVNQAVKLTLAEDAEDLAAFGERKREPNLDFEQLVKALKRRGKLYGSNQAVRGQGD